nr:CAP domain-containing protein [Metabacillus litoralis]
MINNFKIPFRTAAENLAAGQRTPKEVVNAWMNSQGHRANILKKEVSEIGVGYVNGGEYGHYWTQMFISR